MRLPHKEAYTRLGVSAIHGVGVFAVVPILKGPNVFEHDEVEIVWVPLKLLKEPGINPELLRLYHDFGVTRGDVIGVPPTFNSLTPGWYVNEPAPGAAANVALSDGFEFFAIRNIAPGEEVTAVYARYSEPSVLAASL